MNWHQYWEANKDLGLNEATRRFRKMEDEQYQLEYAAWKTMNEAKGAAGQSSGGAAAGGGGSATGAALFAPVVVADASPLQRAIVFYWGTVLHANKYIIQRATDAAFTQNVTTVYTGNSPAQNGVPGYVDYTVTYGTTYYYRGKAQDTNAVYLDSAFGAVTETSSAKVISSNTPSYGKALGVDNL